jgi:SAM-dependent methyltransferase
LNLQSELYSQFDVDPQPITDFVQWLAESYHLHPKVRVLDIGCGPGRMLTEYEKLGWNVSALEPDPDFYQTASDLAARSSNITVDRGGFLDIHIHDEFHLITAINSPFAYLLAVEERIEAISRLYQALQPGGILVLEIANFLCELWNYQARKSEDCEVDGRKLLHVMDHKVDFYKAQWIHYDRYLLDGQEISCKEHRMAIFPLPELFYFMRQRGFLDIQTYGGFNSRKPEEPQGKRVLISARKPALVSSSISADNQIR